MTTRRDYWERDRLPDAEPDEAPLEYAHYWLARGGDNDEVHRFAIIAIAESLQRIADHLDRKDKS